MRATLQAERDTEKKAAKEAQEKADAAQVEAFHKQTTEWMKQPEQTAKYELLNHYGQHDQVGQYVQIQWEQHGRDVTRAQAADELEKYLQGEAEKLTKTKWFQEKFQSKGKPAGQPNAPAPQESATSESKGAPEESEVLQNMRRSLNNSMGMRTAPASDNSFEARLKLAKAALEPK